MASCSAPKMRILAMLPEPDARVRRVALVHELAEQSQLRGRRRRLERERERADAEVFVNGVRSARGDLVRLGRLDLRDRVAVLAEGAREDLARQRGGQLPH